ncbi:MAG TPA: trypsin-like peptidase domain-containing protein [Pyrinomonadaceae bacterium]|nr:trypsin-like peptidase domain-containing protein [Pyrinomonadaceae bacterium]
MLRRKLPPLLLLVALLAAAPDRASAQEATASLPELVRRVKPSVVSVLTYNAKGETLMTGSGFFVRPGRVVTNLHVVERAHRVEVRTFDGKGRTYPADGLLGVDEEGDLAVLSVSAATERQHTAAVAATLPEEGESVFVIGSPLRLEGSVSNGIVSALREVPGLGRIVQITAPISHGNSGSPVFNMRGEVVGVVTIKVTNGQNINLAIESSRLSRLGAGERLLSFDAPEDRERGKPQGEALAEWWYRNGLNSLWLGNYETALSNFENAIGKNPNRAEAWIQVGFCKVKQGKNSEAIRAFQQAIRLRPDSADAHNKLGDAYYYAGNLNKAVESYARAAALEPRHAEARYNLGVAYLELGDRASAVSQSQLLKPLDADMYRKLMREIER